MDFFLLPRTKGTSLFRGTPVLFFTIETSATKKKTFTISSFYKKHKILNFHFTTKDKLYAIQCNAIQYGMVLVQHREHIEILCILTKKKIHLIKMKIEIKITAKKVGFFNCLSDFGPLGTLKLNEEIETFSNGMNSRISQILFFYFCKLESKLIGN